MMGARPDKPDTHDYRPRHARIFALAPIHKGYRNEKSRSIFLLPLVTFAIRIGQHIHDRPDRSMVEPQ